MITKVFLDKENRVHSSVCGPSDVVSTVLTPDGCHPVVVDGSVRYGSDYIYNGASFVYSPRPEPTAVAAAKVRQRRSMLLAESDWTQLPDVPLDTKNSWSSYRQLLRDITDHPGFPLDVVWPEKP